MPSPENAVSDWSKLAGHDDSNRIPIDKPPTKIRLSRLDCLKGIYFVGKTKRKVEKLMVTDIVNDCWFPWTPRVLIRPNDKIGSHCVQDISRVIGNIEEKIQYLQQKLTDPGQELENSEEDDRELLKYMSEFLSFIQDFVRLLREALWLLLLGVGAVRSVFGVRKRPKCTTMPWDIWPSLVVLWGVCWMFYTPISPREQLHGFEDEPFSEFIPDFSSYSGPISSQQPLGDFPFQSQVGIFDTSNTSDLDLFDQTSFLAQGFQPNCDDIQNLETFSAQVAQPVRSMLEADPAVSTRAWHQDMATFTAAASSSTPSQSAMPLINIFSDDPDPHMQASRETSNPIEAPNIPRCNSEGKFICILFGCESGKTYNKRSDWQTHTDKHTLPFHCPEEGCASKSATKGVMKRHLERVHKKSASEASSLSKRTEIVSASSHVNRTQEPFSEASQIPALDKGKGVAKRSLTSSDSARRGEMAPAEILEERSAKKVRLTEDGAVPGIASSECDKGLVAENERLRRELELSQRELILSRKELELSQRELILSRRELEFSEKKSKWYQEQWERD